MATIGTPTGNSMMEALKSGAMGAAGALIFQLVSNFFGSSLIGGAVGIALAGSVVKGEQGKMIATLIGYEMIKSGQLSLPGMGGGSSQQSAESQVSVI
jgi:hypothetical protein